MGIIRRVLRSLPTALGAGALTACAGLLIANMVLGVVAHGHEIRFWSYPWFADLKGDVAPPVKQRLTVRTALDRSFQDAYAKGIGVRVPVFTFAVRLRNQVLYSVFGMSAVPAVVIGAGQELLEPIYIDAYCNRTLAGFVPAARIWARQIREMQDAAERRGQAFLYVITPSKIAQYPEFLPPGLPCRAPAADRETLVAEWVKIVRGAGVHVTDTTAVVGAAHGRYPFLLFPVNGIHWNSVGAALAGEAVAADLAALRDDGTFRPLDFSWHMVDQPSELDTDLLRLLNPMWPPAPQPVPNVILYSEPSPAWCGDKSVVIVGGSFGHAIGAALSLEACHPAVTEYEYWRVFVLKWTDGIVDRHALDEAERSRDLAGASVLIYEENEQLLGQSMHGRALYEALLGHAPG